MFFARESLDCVEVFVNSARSTFEIFSEVDARTVDGVGMLMKVVRSRRTGWLGKTLL